MKQEFETKLQALNMRLLELKRSKEEVYNFFKLIGFIILPSPYSFFNCY